MSPGPVTARSCLAPLLLVFGCGSDPDGASSGATGTGGTGAGTASTGVACEATGEALASLRLTADGARLRDAAGREILLRGVNSGGRSKFPPYLPFPFAGSGHPTQVDEPGFEEQLARHHDLLQRWGATVVRVPFSWEALEPSPGVIDEAYLGRYVAMLEDLDARGIRAIVDFHQDVYSRLYCGDGFPPWTIPEPHPDLPPVEDCANWTTGYLADDRVDAAFDRFWANDDGIRDAFLAMWDVMVERTRHVDAVIGYEVINEPHPGTMDEATWAQTVLPELYEEVAMRVRAADPGALVFFDNGALDGADDQSSLRPLVGDGFVFAPHYYNQQVFLFGPDDADYDTDEGIGAWAAQGKAWDRPVLLGEFGVKTSFEGSPAYLRANWDSLDRFLLSGTIWEYSSTLDDWNDEGFGLVEHGFVETPSAATVPRIHPVAVSGDATSFWFDPDTGEAELVFAAVPGTSELVVPAALATAEPVVELSGVDGCSTWDPDRSRILVQTVESGEATVTVSISP